MLGLADITNTIAEIPVNGNRIDLDYYLKFSAQPVDRRGIYHWQGARETRHLEFR